MHLLEGHMSEHDLCLNIPEIELSLGPCGAAVQISRIQFPVPPPPLPAELLRLLVDRLHEWCLGKLQAQVLPMSEIRIDHTLVGETWTVFFPDHLVNSASGFLKGCIDDRKCVACVFTISRNMSHTEYDIDRIIGIWRRHDDAINDWFHSQQHDEANNHKRSVFLNISLSSKGIWSCDVFQRRKKADQCAVCVIFNPRALLSSFLICESTESIHVSELHDCVSHIIRVYKSHQEHISNGICVGSSTTSKAPRLIFTVILHIMTTSLFCLKKFLDILSFKCFLNYLSVQPPEFVKHISNKLSRFRQIQSANVTSKEKLVLFDICSQQLLDSFLGLMVMAFVIHRGCAGDVASFIMHWVDVTAFYLNDLLHWLMGAPAGLKLNSQLAGYMGNFFLYHVYLWTGYLSLLQPILGLFMWCAACTGIFGISSQLCVAQDILSMLTIHIYCFYVYAARIYRLQLYALSSLWRLFRGKKWNVLRLRVDSATYNIDQLFVGTLLFTILLFLLPTTALYYFVFTTLRLLLLFSRGMMSQCVLRLNNIPVYTLLLWILHSKAVTGGVKFTVQKDKCCSTCLVLCMKTVHLPFYKLYKKAQYQMVHGEKTQLYTWSQLLKRLAVGNLIYPWINQTRTPIKEKQL